MHRYARIPVYRSPSLSVCRLFCLVLLFATGCSSLSLSSAPTSTPTLTPLPSPTPWPTPTPSPTPWPTFTPEPPDTGWKSVQIGIELRQVRVETGAVAERLTIVRLDPARVRFRVHYDPQTPRPVGGWATLLQPLMVINGGYFAPEYETIGLLISDGQVWGTSYGDYAGMFTVTYDDRVDVRWLGDQPYDPNEPLREAIQSFPVLVKPGIGMGFPAEADDGRPARRTVVAQDRQGRILFVVAPHGYLSLHKMARFLVESDLDLHVALNLDGGNSTGLSLKTNEHKLEIASLVPVPAVITVDYR